MQRQLVKTAAYAMCYYKRLEEFVLRLERDVSSLQYDIDLLLKRNEEVMGSHGEEKTKVIRRIKST